MRTFLGLIALLVGAVLTVLGVMGALTFGPSGTLEATSSPLRSGSQSYALVADVIGVNTGFPGSTSLGKTTVGARAQGSGRLFVGVAPRDSVDEYLFGSPFDAVRQEGGTWSTKPVPGTTDPGAPMDQDFWLRRATGSRPTVDFVTSNSGPSTFVIMNEDGEPAVNAQMTIGFTSPWIFPISIGAAVVGVLLLLEGGYLLLRRKRAEPEVVADPIPANVTGEDPR